MAEEAERRYNGYEDSTAQLRMILRNRQGQTSERELRVRSLEVADGTKSLCLFDTPQTQESRHRARAGSFHSEDEHGDPLLATPFQKPLQFLGLRKGEVVNLPPTRKEVVGHGNRTRISPLNFLGNKSFFKGILSTAGTSFIKLQNDKFLKSLCFSFSSFPRKRNPVIAGISGLLLSQE